MSATDDPPVALTTRSEETPPLPCLLADADPAWPYASAAPSLHDALAEMQGRVAAPPPTTCCQHLAFLGPAVLVSVGYMDPGNWATNLAAGSAFGFAHLFVILFACLAAMFLQTLTVRLGIATGRNLAQACRDAYAPWVATSLWFTAEVAIAATDIAEVIGSAIGLKLLLGLPLAAGAALTLVDVLLFSCLLSRVRLVEGVVALLVGFIAAIFIALLVMAQPPAGPVMLGFVPSAAVFLNSEALYAAIGILGATVMPHNLYLHSALVQTRALGAEGGEDAKPRAAAAFTIDTVLSLSLALFVNSAILTVAAAAFYGSAEVGDLESAAGLLAPLLGSTAAPVLFALALLAAGQNSTLTGVMAGQVVMEGFVNWKVSPTLRRLVSRLATLVPVLTIALAVGDAGINNLLILSQVVLSFQLPFAMVPLVHFTGSAQKMGTMVSSRATQVCGGVLVLFITGLNAYLIVMTCIHGLE